MVITAPMPVYQILYCVMVLMACLASMLLPVAVAAAVTPGISLSTDSDSAYLGDTLVIEMEAVGILDTVDISALFKEAELIRETTGTRIAVLEERVVEVKLRRMEFLPGREGRLVFGPVQGESIAGPVTSNTIVMTVLPATKEQWQPGADDLQISLTLSDGLSGRTISADKQTYSAYIGQRIIADIVLRHRHAIAEENITLPDFDGFDVFTDYEQRRTIQNGAAPKSHRSNSNATALEKTDADSSVTGNTGDVSDNGGSFRVIAWRYHLFAQRSGTINIGSVSWRGEAIRSRTKRAQFAQQTPPNPVQIKPALGDAGWWLPASTLSLTESWSSDARELTAGDEVVRTITLKANDILASQLPQIQPLKSRALSATLINQSRTQQLVGDHIEATATFKFRMLAQSPIPVFLDTVRVPWYDTVNARLREAIIPARRINVGLPDRADLLTELAMSERWIDRITLELQSAASRFAFWHLSLAGLGLVAGVLLVQDTRQRMQERRGNKAEAAGSDVHSLPGL